MNIQNLLLTRINPIVKKHYEYIFLAVLFTGAVVVRILYTLQLLRTPYFSVVYLDSEYYHSWALKILNEGILGTGVFYGNPLYPYFLALIYKLFGVHLEVVRIVQHLLGLLTCFFVYRIGKRYFSLWVGFVSAALLAFYRGAIMYEGCLLIATLSLFLHTCAVWILAEYDRNDRIWQWAAAGIIMGLAILARGSAIVFAVPVWLIVSRMDIGLRRRILAVGIYSIAICAAAFPLTVRNYLADGRWIITAPHWGEAFYVGNNPESTGANTQPSFVRPTPFHEHEDFRRQAEKISGRQMDLVDSSYFWFDQAKRFIRDHPAAYIKLLGKKVLYFFQGYERPDNENIGFLQKYMHILNLPLVTFGLISPLCIVGLILLALERQMYQQKLIIFIFLFYASTIIAFFVTSRYRIPVISMMILSAGYGAAKLMSLWQRMEYKRLGVYTAVLLVAGVVCNTTLGKNNDMVIEFNQMGTMYNKIERPDRGYAWFLRAYRVNPDISMTLYNLGVASRMLNRYDEALTWFKKSLVNNEFANQSYYEIGAIYYQSQQLDQAIAALQAALKIDPDYESAMNLLAICYASAGKPEKAEQLWNKIVERNKEYIDAWYNLGIWYFQKNDRPMAVRCFEEVKKRHPSYRDLDRYLQELNR